MFKKKSKISTKDKVLLVVFMFLLAVFAYVLFNMFSHIQTFRQHRIYFQLPFGQQHIQEWMTINSIERHYHVDVAAVLHKELTLTDLKKTLSAYCSSTKIDCKKLVTDLENAKSINIK